jgi:hypothetical protein
VLLLNLLPDSDAHGSYLWIQPQNRTGRPLKHLIDVRSTAIVAAQQTACIGTLVSALLDGLTAGAITQVRTCDPAT